MQHPFSDLPEFASLAADRGIVRIPMEQDVPFTPRVRALIDTTEFQRLRHVSQLGLVSYVYPGATHSRFEHALGVFHNAIRYLWQLGRDPRFCQLIDTHHAELLLASALLHDIGHWPFCHPIEDLCLPNTPAHEVHAAEFLSPHTELSQALREVWHIDPQEVLDVLVPKTDRPELRVLRSILSGPIDIDKLDYLERDSLHCGVPYGRHFDKHRLIQSLILNETGDGLAINQKGKTASELMVFARYVMFSEVYWHHTVRSATTMFQRAFFEMHRDIDHQSLFRMGESETIQFFRQRAQGTSAERLIENVFGPRRQLFKRVAEYNHYQSHEVYVKLARRPFESLVGCSRRLIDEINRCELLGSVRLADTDILIDAPPPHREIEFNVSIFFPKEHLYRPLHTVSPVVDALAKTQFDDYVKRVRVFARPDQAHALSECPKFEAALVAACD